MCAILYFFTQSATNIPHANPTIIYENIKEIHILAVGGNLEFPILSHMLLRRACGTLAEPRSHLARSSFGLKSIPIIDSHITFGGKFLP